MKKTFILLFFLYTPFYALTNDQLKEVTHEKIKFFNKNNPLSDDFQLLEKLKPYLDNPRIQKLVSIFSTPETTELIQKISAHPDKRKLGIQYIILIIFLVLFRWALISRETEFIGRIWTSFWTFILLNFTTLFIFPYYHFGEDYLKFLKLILKVFKSVF